MSAATGHTPSAAATTRKVAYAVVLVAIGVALAPYTSFPIGIAKVNPTQHFINVIGAVVLGPWWAVLVAMVIGIIRNALGVGSLLALVPSFLASTIAGALLGVLALKFLQRADIIDIEGR